MKFNKRVQKLQAKIALLHSFISISCLLLLNYRLEPVRAFCFQTGICSSGDWLKKMPMPWGFCVNQVTALEMIVNVNGQLSLYITHWSSMNFVTIWKINRTLAEHFQNTFTLVFQCGETYFLYSYLIDGTIAALDWHIYTLSVSALLPCLSVLPLRIASHFVFSLNLHRVPQYLLLDYRLLLFAETLRISIMIHCLFLDPVLTGNVQASPSESISHISVVQSGLSWQTQG